MATKKNAGTTLQQARAGASSRLLAAREQLESRVNESADSTRKAIRKRPLTAVGIAAGTAVVVGVVAASALARRTNGRKRKETQSGE
jgi:ElaB/YqjD/DUF883 family membrane-anchored ribosome-binding protein